MTPEAARSALSEAAHDEEPVVLTPNVLAKLSLRDVPEGSRYQIGTFRSGA